MKTKVLVITIVALLLIGGGVGAYLLLKDNEDVEVMKTTKPDEGINIEEKNEKISKLENDNENLSKQIEELQLQLDNNKGNNANKVVSKEKLTQQELDYFTKYFEKGENNGFLLSEYYNVKDIDFKELLYSGLDNSGSATKELKEINGEEPHTDVSKSTTNQIIQFFKEKTGITLTKEEVAKKLNSSWIYSAKYDAYYDQHGDTNAVGVKCIKGYKTNEGEYVVVCAMDNGSEEKTAVIMLQKENGKYLVVSNILM